MNFAIREGVDALVYIVTAPDFSCGFILHRGTVVGGQDRLRFMRDWNLWQVIKYCRHRGWLLEQVKR